MFTLVEFIAITLATATSDTHRCSCLGHLGQHDTNRIVSISCRIAQGGQGKNMLCRYCRCFCQNNIAIVNDPLLSTNLKGHLHVHLQSLRPYLAPKIRSSSCVLRVNANFFMPYLFLELYVIKLFYVRNLRMFVIS